MMNVVRDERREDYKINLRYLEYMNIKIKYYNQKVFLENVVSKQKYFIVFVQMFVNYLFKKLKNKKKRKNLN